MNAIGHWHPDNMRQKASELRSLWLSKPSTTLWQTACRLGLGHEEAEYLVNSLTAAGVVRYEGNPFRAVFV